MSTSCVSARLTLDTRVPVWPSPKAWPRGSRHSNRLLPSPRIYDERRSRPEERHMFKVAYPDGRSGDIHIRLWAEGEHVTLRVHDTGIGFPEGFDFRNTESLGLQLVGMMTEQLGGTLTLTCEGGTTFTVSIPMARGR